MKVTIAFEILSLALLIHGGAGGLFPRSPRVSSVPRHGHLGVVPGARKIPWDALTDERRNYKRTPPKPAYPPLPLQEKKVKIHMYRGSNEHYTVWKDTPEKKSFATWGYFVSQPIGIDKWQPNHELSFNFS